MIRRYSRPRHFTAGWESPRPPLWMNDSGLTTIPSPPVPVSSSHQATPAAWLGRVGHVHDQVRRRPQDFGVGPADLGQRLHVPGVVLVECGRAPRWRAGGTGPASGRQRVHLPAIVGGRRRRTSLDVLACRRLEGVHDGHDLILLLALQTARPPLLQGRRHARGSAADPADPTAAYWVRRSSWALADHGISSQSRHAHDRLQPRPEVGGTSGRRAPGRGTAAPGRGR